MKLTDLTRITEPLKASPRMPVLFLGHGSPMNAIEENEFVQGFRQAASELPRPQAILVVSAHWETRGTQVTAMAHPRTIHDFGGFPKALFDVQYPAPGSPELAEEVKRSITSTPVGLDHSWGLDHGAWSVVKHLYPQADVPIIQMSIDYSMKPEQHYALAKEIAALRDKGVLIIGSGNMVHNLGMVAWDKLNESEYGFDWALELNTIFKKRISDEDHQALVRYPDLHRAAKLAIPTPDHYYPLLYALGTRLPGEEPRFFNDRAVGGSLTMTSVQFG